MRLTFLGTGASEGFPAPFCDCTNCEAARRAGGPSLRKRCLALVDDALLIDLGPDLIAACQAHGVSLAAVRHLLMTHEHGDHLDAGNLEWRSFYRERLAVLDVYASAGALSVLESALAPYVAPDGLASERALERLRARFHRLTAGQSVEVGPFRVTTVPTLHDPRLEVLLYLIERDGRCLFYATDTSRFPDETWRFLRERRPTIDLLAMDHTFGFGPSRSGHLNADEFGAQVARLRSEGFLAPGARVFAHHLAHSAHPAHDEVTRLAAERGYEVAHDGLSVDV